MNMILKIGQLFFCLLGIAVAFFVFFVNPSHWRAPETNLANLNSFNQFYIKSGSLLSGNVPFSIDRSDLEIGAAKQILSGLYVDAPLLTESSRFKSKNQVYFSAGMYPFRLDGLDALLIPNGATLSFRILTSRKTQIRMMALSPSALGVLEVQADASWKKKWSIADVSSNGPISPSFLDRKAPGVFDFDKTGQITSWVPINFEASHTVSITCRDSAFGCLVGDPGLYEPSFEQPQNYLVILIDTMRWDAIKNDTAPHIDDLGRKSTRFLNALAPGNMTAPSTNAFLSCRKAGAIGEIAFAYSVDSRRRESFYSKRKPSFPQIFADAGFNAAMIGNISVISEAYGVGVSHGFQRQVSIEVDPFDTPLIAREAINWLAENGDTPFLLYLHFNGPHAPYRAPWSDLFRVFHGINQDLSSYSNFLKWIYRGEIAYTDTYVGQVLEALKRLGLDKSTTIVLTADHGDQHAVRSFVGNHVADDFVGSYFDHGATLYNDEIRVPLLIRQAGQSYAQERRDFVSTLDVAPTLLNAANLQIPAYCDGVSLQSKTEDRVLGSEGFKGRAIIFNRHWKYIRTYEPNDKIVHSKEGLGGKKRLFMVPEELFDLSSDSEETRSRITDRPELLTQARSLYRQYFNIGEAFELVIDDPSGKGWVANIPSGIHVESSRATVTVESVDAGKVARATEGGRFLLTLRGFLTTEPLVEIGGEKVFISKTTQRLPIQIPFSRLPLEVGGELSLLPLTDRAGAILRRIDDDGQAGRRMIVGNPKFEAVLREWGYLNDQ